MTSDSNADPMEGVNCPACKNMGYQRAVEAQGMVVTAAQAIVTNNFESIQDCMSIASPEDFHLAVTLYVDAIATVCQTWGMSLTDYFKEARALNVEELRKLGGIPPVPDSSSDEGSGV